MGKTIRPRVIMLGIVSVCMVVLLLILAINWLDLFPKQVVHITFEEKMDYLINRLQSIKSDLLAENGEEMYTSMLNGIDRALDDTDYKDMEVLLERKKIEIANDQDNLDMIFYKYGPRNLDRKDFDKYITMPSVCAAQGQRWCTPTVGLIFSIIDPNIEFDVDLYSVTVPEFDEDIGTIIIPVKYIDTRFGAENIEYNRMIYDNAMQYVYRFFEGKIDNDELDDAIAVVIEGGQGDKTVSQMYKDAKHLDLASDERKELDVKVGKAQFFPKTKIEKKFRGRKYVLKYDNFLGNVIIEYPLLEFVMSQYK